MFRKTLQNFLVFLIILICTGAISVAVAPIQIQSPLSTIPEFVKRGEILKTIFKAGENTSNFSASISTEYVQIPLSITSAKFQPENQNWEIDVKIPIDAPIELYDLKISSSVAFDKKTRAVKVIDNYKDDFSFVQVTDVHCGVEKNEKIFAKVIEEINLINPEFVLITGDLTTESENVCRALMIKEGKKVKSIYTDPYKNLSDEESKQFVANEYNRFLNLLSKFRVPTYVIPGNHDMVGLYNEPCLKFYEEMIGRRYYSFDYGNYHFTGIDNSNMMEASPLLYPDFKDELDDKQLLWLEEDLKKNIDKKLKFAFFHCPLENPMQKKKGKFRELLENFDVDMALSGHLHYDMVYKKGKPIWILTTSIIEPAQFQGKQESGYRIIKVKEGKIDSYSYFSSDGKHSIPYNNLNYKFLPENNGKNYEVTCSIENKLKEDFHDAMLKFVMPKDAAYEVVDGELKQEIAGENFKMLYVKVNIPREKEIKVIVRKTKSK